MADRTDDPFSEIERMFDQLTQFGAGSDMPVDVVDEGDAFVVTADLPGFDTDDVQVQLEDEYKLSVEAERTTTDSVDEGDFVRRERHTQSVGRTVRLPAPVDETATEATYDSGVLTVRLGKETGDDEGTDIPVN